jgi:hypothetical protein
MRRSRTRVTPFAFAFALALALGLVGAAGCGRVGFAGEPDASVDAYVDLACDPRTTGGVVALYSFDDSDLFADATGAHPGAARGTPAAITGPCTSALGVTGATDYGLVERSPAFALADGAIDFYARVDALGGRRGLVSRDASGTDIPGHISIAIAGDGMLWVRLQDSAAPNDHFRCSDAPVTAGAWFHVGVSFGANGLALWIDHVAQTARATATSVYDDASPVDCQLPFTGGIAGADEPWVFGALAWTSPAGLPEPSVVDGLATGALDHVRIRDTWIDFASP